VEAALEAIGAFAAEDTPRRGQATIAAGAIHITGNRSRFVHFSLPYFDTAYRLVVKRPVLAWPARPSCVLGRVGGSS
jgi:hypothetical protein